MVKYSACVVVVVSPRSDIEMVPVQREDTSSMITSASSSFSTYYHKNQGISLVLFVICSLIVTLIIPGLSYAEELHGPAAPDGEEKFCPIEATVDLEYAVQNTSGFIDHLTGRLFPRDIVKEERDGARKACLCDLKPCLPICSTTADDQDNEFDFVKFPNVYTTNLTLDNDERPSQGPEDRFHILTWTPCDDKNAYLLEPDKYPGDEFYLLGNGSLFLPRQAQVGARLLGLERYCFGLRSQDSQNYTPRVCSAKVSELQDQDGGQLARVKYVGALLAVPFLIATVIVYSVLPELRNIHGTTLRCYLCCLVVTYVALAADRIPPPDRSAGPLCMFLGFTIYFFFLACFFWLNVMCVDMWWRFGGFGSLRTTGAQRDSKKFIGYSMYAWGSAFLMTSICIGMEFSPGIPESMIRPEFRLNACWFNTQAAGALYFFGPIGITIAFNVCFFVATSFKIVQHTRDTQRQLNSGDSRRHDDNKQWFSLYLKLSVIMGITWSTEVISWLWKGPKYLWLATDMLNALQGFLIFFIFVWKKKIWKSLKKRWNELRFTTKGCTRVSSNSDSPRTTGASSSDTVCCSVSVLVLDELKTPEKENTNRNDHQDPQVPR